MALQLRLLGGWQAKVKFVPNVPSSFMTDHKPTFGKSRIAISEKPGHYSTILCSECYRIRLDIIPSSSHHTQFKMCVLFGGSWSMLNRRSISLVKPLLIMSTNRTLSFSHCQGRLHFQVTTALSVTTKEVKRLLQTCSPLERFYRWREGEKRGSFRPGRETFEPFFCAVSLNAKLRTTTWLIGRLVKWCCS